jgi:C-terminal processing protease CtpA/Prc
MTRGGIGLGIADNNKTLVVQYLVEGGPAAESNFFDIGDEITAVDRYLFIS